MDTAAPPTAQPPDEAWRAEVLRSFGAEGAVLDELLAYNRNPYADEVAGDWSADEAFVADWERYEAEARAEGLAAVLRRCMVHLGFPVREGISAEPAWREVVMRGEPLEACALREPWQPRDPEGLRLRLQPTSCGRIPVISVRDRADFEGLLQRILYRNEPKPIPPSMGATMVAGYNNWERIRRHIANWRAAGGTGEWREEFSRLVPRKPLYQDRFIVVSEGPYSSVPAAALGLDDESWRALSLELRIHHECGHYLTKRRFGMMRNNLLDEMLADALGLVGASGAYRAEWFLTFMGLEAGAGAPRAGGRIEVYRGEPPLSQEAFAIVQALVVQAARGLERHFGPGAAEPPGAASIVAHFRAHTLESMAAEGTA